MEGNSWTKIDAIAIDTTKTPLSGPEATIVFVNVNGGIKKAVRVQLRDGRQGYVRVSYGVRYFDSMNLVFHPLDGVEVVQS